MLFKQSGAAFGPLPAQIGRVSLRGSGSFTGNNETTFDHGQLPQFLPRIQWPDGHVAQILGRHTSALGTGIDWTVRSEVEDLRDRVTSIYSCLAPMPSFASGLYDETPWLAHVAFMHDILHCSISNQIPLAELEMFALLRTTSYGMFESMAWLYPWHIPGPCGDDKLAEEWRPDFSMRMKVGEFQEPGSDEQYYQSRMYGRRWVVAPVLCGEEQWSMTIFDRCQGHLYIFDSGDGPRRSERIEACVHLWVRFWNWLHLPWDFQYFVPTATRQTSAKDSGLISIAWLMFVLRDQVGGTMSVDDVTVRRADVVITAADPGVEIEPSDLCLRDWLPDGCKLAYGGLMAVRRIIKAMVCNELGLAHHEVLTKEFRNYDGRVPGIIPSALTLLRNMGTQLAAHDSMLPPDLFWTAQGGPQFAMAQRIVAGPYQHDAPRRHRPHTQQRRFRVEATPDALARRTTQEVQWPAGVPFTAENPVNRPACGAELEVAGVDTRRDLDTLFSLHFDATLANCEAPQFCQHLRRPQRIELGDIHTQRHSSGCQVLKLHLVVGLGSESASEGLTVDIPINKPGLGSKVP
ncbi:hypothetical protein HRG_001677 [Hirsutella rhossiliensis]|uniref:Uncharacterized protein n=1 Tax=Hirsutella rhossiliensis TaxID=111463 RepID=A0A9P8N256_9HYPO|nr:uncharacterized protein HRG_01677 [Hirsutella rhossiliensis]KAH0966268.1 hypothetical protein HRG_01677 [Hirsutella rhossiliensis]